jgi:bacillolysin
MAAAPRQPALSALAVGIVVLAGSLAGTPNAVAADEPAAGFMALSGEAAARFRVPKDARLSGRLELPALDLSVERYQQTVTSHRAAVEGGQLSVYRRDGVAVLVIGAHYPAARARNRLLIDERRASAAAAADRRLEGGRPDRPRLPGADAGPERSASLRLDPASGRLFYRVETRAPGVREMHWVDAESGQVFHALDAVADDHGTGVKLDTKSLSGGSGKADDLTSKPGASWRMRSVDGRLVVYDARNGFGIWNFPGDSDNYWTSSYQRAAVDAQYYARTTDDFLRRRFGLDLLAGCGLGQISSVVHAGSSYANAYWDGQYVVYGDGDKTTFRGLSGAQDVVSHELLHAVTDCTSGLLYENESGALSEAFSDIFATVAEHGLAEPKSSRCRRESGQAGCPDWWIAEDAWIGGGAHGIRSLANPAAGDQPSHYSGLYEGPMDRGGVHINSGIANHAFYLMAQGGRNARCRSAGGVAADCDALVPGVGMSDAARIAFVAYTSLPETAGFCAARSATMATAEALHPGSVAHAAAAELSWAAVGVDGGACEAAPADLRATLGQRSAAARPGGPAVTLPVALERGLESGDVTFAVTGLPEGWYSLDPVTSVGPAGTGTSVVVTVPPGAADGLLPFLVSVSSPGRILQLPAVLIVDGSPPAVTTPSAGLARGTVVPPSGGMPLSVTWAASDTMSGMAETKLEVSVNGGPWVDAPVDGAPTADRATVSVAGGLHRFRVRATDQAGNAAVSAASAAFAVTGSQEGAAKYSSGWSTMPPTQGWGSVRYARTADRTATLRFVGREVAWVAQTGPKRGKARVYIDGVLVGKVDLYSAARVDRAVVFVASGLKAGVEHRLRIVTIAPSARPRVDVDGFLVLNR